MLIEVWSGGQTGADRAGWRAAKRFGIVTGGWMPAGFKAEDGFHPEFAEQYAAKEHKSAEYPPRTRENVRWADVTVVFDTDEGDSLSSKSPGTKLAIRTAINEECPSLVVVVTLGEPPTAARTKGTADWLAEKGAEIVNVGGNRESTSPGIGEWVELYLSEVFRHLGHHEIEQPGGVTP